MKCLQKENYQNLSVAEKCLCKDYSKIYVQLIKHAVQAVKLRPNDRGCQLGV